MKIEGLAWYLSLLLTRDWHWAPVETEVTFWNNTPPSSGSLNLEKSVVLPEKPWVHTRSVPWWQEGTGSSLLTASSLVPRTEHGT